MTVKLRTAKKIAKAIGTPDGDRYSEFQKMTALCRLERTASGRQDRRFYHALMVTLGPRGRAEVLAYGAPAMAFDLLMRTPEEQWKYGPDLLATLERSQ